MNAESRRIVAGHYRRSARRADGIEHIELQKVSPLAGKLIQVRGIHPSATVAGQITPTPVIRIDQNDIRLLGPKGPAKTENRKCNEYREKRVFHRVAIAVTGGVGGDSAAATNLIV